MAQQQNLRKFVLGGKEFEEKKSEFVYDHGWYSISDINGEERNEIYRSRNAQEAYMKWNVYIGRKKERPVRDTNREDRDYPGENRERRNRYNDHDDKNSHKDQESTELRKTNRNEYKGEEKAPDKNKKKNGDKHGNKKPKGERKGNNYRKNGQGKNTKGDRAKKQYKRQDNKFKTTDWDSMV